MTTPSKHQSGTGQGVEFQSRQRHTENYKYKRCEHPRYGDECEKLCIPTVHAKRRRTKTEARRGKLNDEECEGWHAALRVEQCSFVEFGLTNHISLGFVTW